MTTPPTPPPSPGAEPGFEPVAVPPVGTHPPGYPPTAVYPPTPGYYPPPPQRKPMTVLKIVLIVLGVVVALGALGAAVVGYGAYKITKSMHRNANGDLSLTTPNGTFTTGGEITATDLGVPEYPGAKRAPGSVKMSLPGGSLVTAIYSSVDPPSAVAAFYQERMDGATVVERNGKTTLTRGGDADKTVVAVAPQAEGSKITIVHHGTHAKPADGTLAP